MINERIKSPITYKIFQTGHCFMDFRVSARKKKNFCTQIWNTFVDSINKHQTSVEINNLPINNGLSEPIKFIVNWYYSVKSTPCLWQEHFIEILS